MLIADIHNIVSRWWQSKGFGIQSRTDYEYLKEVLHQPLPYYAYDEVTDKQARLIFRICNNAAKQRVVLLGTYNQQEVRAAHIALGKKPDIVQQLHHFHGIDTLIVKDIQGDNNALWQRLLETKCITWDMNNIGLAQFSEGRYPEHYLISS